jgi:hypothetical protein
MNLYGVFVPADDGAGGALERATFVKQGFSREAFVLTPLWAARRGLWRAFAFWLVWVGVVAGLALAFRLDGEVVALIYLVGAFAFGLEGDRLEQFQLKKSGFALQAFSLGASEREADQVFFEGPAKDLPAPAPPPAPGEKPAPPPASVAQAGAIDLLGLFHPGN